MGSDRQPAIRICSRRGLFISAPNHPPTDAPHPLVEIPWTVDFDNLNFSKQGLIFPLPSPRVNAGEAGETGFFLVLFSFFDQTCIGPSLSLLQPTSL